MPRRPARAFGPYIAFLALFLSLLLIVTKWYLLPVLSTVHDATPTQRKILGAYALLLLLLILSILAFALLLAYRFSRTRNRETPKPRPTKYVDAWAEAGKRFNEKDSKE